VPEKLALIGACIVLLLYLLVGGRTYCSWVCPVNLLTDFAYWLRVRLGSRAAPISAGRPATGCWA
jgi:ferredoxin-type protein NapH